MTIRQETPMRTLKTRAASVGAVIALAATLAACGGSSSAGSDKSPADANDLSKVACPLSALPRSGPKVKISLWYGNQQGKNKSVMEEIADSYNASQDRVQVTASDQGQDYDAMLSKYTRAMQGGQIPNVLFADSTHSQFLVDSGTIIPGGACAKQGAVPVDRMYPVVRSFYTLDGAYIPGSVNMTATMMYFNKVSYAKANLTPSSPGTLAQMHADAKKLKAAGIADMKWPVSMIVSSAFFNAFLTGIGQDVVDHDDGHEGHATKATFDTPAAVKLLKDLQSMYDDGSIAKISNTPGQLNQYLNVAQGKSAMVMETSAAATTVEAFLGGGLSADDLKEGGLGGLTQGAKIVPGFGEMPGIDKPGQVPVTGGAYFVTNGGTKAQQAAAMDFISYLNEMPQQTKWLIEGSYLSGNELVAEQPAVKKFFSDTVSGTALEVAAKQMAAVPADHPGPIVGPFDQYDKIVQSMLESVLFNGADPAGELRKAEAKVTAALRSYNSDNGF
jgi:sn-glycerol 3-phosphate transport system substrate-binding protein